MLNGNDFIYMKGGWERAGGGGLRVPASLPSKIHISAQNPGTKGQKLIH